MLTPDVLSDRKEIADFLTAHSPDVTEFAEGDNPQHYPVARIAMNVIDCPRNRKQIGTVFQNLAEKLIAIIPILGYTII